MHIPYAGTAPASAGTVPCLRAGKSRPKLALLLIPIVPKIRLFRKVQLHRKMPNFLVDNYAICPSFHFFSGISVIFAGGNHRVFVGIDGKHGAFPGFGSGGQGRLPGCSFSAWPGYGCCFFHSAVAGVLFSAWLGFGCCFFYSAVAGVFFSAWLGFRCCFFHSAVAGVFFSAWLGFRCCFFHSAVAGVLLSSLKEEPRKVPPISTRWTHDQGNLSPGPQPEDTLCRPANDRCSALPCGPRVRWVTHGCCR